MIQKQTFLKSADNSGAKFLKCIQVFKNSNKKKNILGKVVLVSVKELRNKSKITSKVLKGSVFRSVVVRSKNHNFIKDGSFFSLFKNSSVLINSQNKLVGTRVFGPVPKSLRRNKFLKFVSISTGFF